MSTKIHPTAIVDPNAQIAEDVEIGPHSVIEANVKLGARTKIGPLVHIQGATTLGPDNVVHTGATLGFPPQYSGFDGSQTLLIIGARNTIREYVSIHRGLKMDTATRIGDDCFFMGASHIAHDCIVGNGVIMANGALLAGHVEVGDRAFISGNAAVHQFSRIGRLAMVGGLARVTRDVPPFTIVEGHPGRIRGLNLVGMRRAGIAPHARLELKRLLHMLFLSDQSVTEVLAQLRNTDFGLEAREFIAFMKSGKRGISPYKLRKLTNSAGTAADASGDDDDE